MRQLTEGAEMSSCPSCEEPLESGDLYCGACGFDLSAAPEPVSADDHPTIAINGAAPQGGSAPQAPQAPQAPEVPQEPAASVQWPEAPDASTSTHHPGELRGTDSSGGELPGAGAPAAEPAAAVRFDHPQGADEYALQAPDPRTVAPAAATPPAGTKLCVACRTGTVDQDGYCEHCGHAQPRERDHMERELDAVAAVSDRGLRHHRNEDAFAVSATALPDGSPAVVAIVCDGVSSATRPDEASAAASQAANESLLASLPRGTHPQQAMHDAIIAASDAVNSLAQDPAHAREHDPHRHQNAPACTLVGSVIAGGLLVVGWVGDSRVYWVPEDRTAPAARLTEDDSWAAQMVAAGLMNEEEAYADERAHAITGWLGADAYELEPHTASFKPDRAGVVVVCTDGLWNYAEGAAEMAAVVPADAAERPLHCAQVLVGHALDGGGHDNVTVAVLPFSLTPQGAGSA
ncbi:serine/threonine-protein phosphatase [Streptomyces sp. TRM66268-LWL]|uniref:Serine/threonine-protein phosphatase n=1 Tax=Streptomyces polyasparticus TaxID=2767826 RepID=A0ABR7SUM9_9ACTN|nr:PP2C family serine/threonine-protein phosphatase [Streptomyces polyasparticus]MBC9718063.1 serine/threonine-protein phosphatase [Streptomyces polyasparticus]